MSQDPPETSDRRIRSFVIRGGRMTASQQLALDQQFEHYGLQPESGIADWATVFGNDHPVVLEIGFGMGDSLATMAQAEPHVNFVGVEVHRPGVGRLMALANKAALNNLRIYNADVIDVLHHCIAANSLARINIYFPDPWHKKRHHKRRLIRPELIEKLKAVLQADGILHIATDWQPYAEAVVELFTTQRQFTNVAGKETYVNREDFGRPITKFEKRGQRLGHGVWDIVYRYRPIAELRDDV